MSEERVSIFDLSRDLYELTTYGCPEITDKDTEEEKAQKEAEISAFNDTLNVIMECIQDKADDYCYALDNVKDKRDRLKAEIDRLTTWKNCLDNAEKRMKEALKHTLEIMREQGMEKPEIVTDLHRITLQKVGGKQKMEITGEVPDNFKRIVYEDDKDKIREALEKGEELSFAHLAPRAETARIR